MKAIWGPTKRPANPGAPGLSSEVGAVLGLWATEAYGWCFLHSSNKAGDTGGQ